MSPWLHGSVRTKRVRKRSPTSNFQIILNHQISISKPPGCGSIVETPRPSCREIPSLCVRDCGYNPNLWLSNHWFRIASETPVWNLAVGIWNIFGNWILEIGVGFQAWNPDSRRNGWLRGISHGGTEARRGIGRRCCGEGNSGQEPVSVAP